MTKAYTISLPEVIRRKADILCKKLAEKQGYDKPLSFSGLINELLIEKMTEMKIEEKAKEPQVMPASCGDINL